MDPTESLPEDDDLTVLEYVRHWIDGQFKVRVKSAGDIRAQSSTLDNPVSVKPIFWIGLTLIVVGQFLLGLQRQSLPIAGLLVIVIGMASLWFGIPNGNTKTDKIPSEETEGNKFRFYAPGIVYNKVDDGDRDGIQLAQTSFDLTGSMEPGDDEIALLLL